MRPRRTRTPPLVGRYTLLEEIGRGATGSVWTTWDRRSRRLVAAKVLQPGPGAVEATMLLRFVREQALRISHPHVLAPHGWAADDEAVLIITDLVRGGSLRDLLEERPRLPESLVALLLDQLLQGLVAVHEHGVVHGDVKPANLLLEATGAGRPHLRLADFGVATCVDDDVRFVTAGPVGTPGFLPPEQLAGAAPDPSQDVYAAGVVARGMLARPGAITTLADSMTRTDPVRRPSAAAALRRLRTLPIRRGDGAWPPVPDRLAALSRGSTGVPGRH